MAEKKIVEAKRKTNVKGIMHPSSVRPKTIVRRTRIKKKTLEKTMQTKSLTNRRGIYFSDNLSISKDMRKDQNYFKKQSQKGIKNDKPLYIFDLSRVSSKYIGKTEKNLGRIFQSQKDERNSIF